MEISLTLCLPRESRSIPVSRHLLTTVLAGLGVSQGCIDDIALAQTEACGNVIRHATAGQEYEVRAHLDAARCRIEVTDAGPGFARTLAAGQPDPRVVDGRGILSESGRGIALMRATVDALDFRSGAGGTTVCLEKALRYEPDQRPPEGLAITGEPAPPAG